MLGAVNKIYPAVKIINVRSFLYSAPEVSAWLCINCITICRLIQEADVLIQKDVMKNRNSCALVTLDCNPKRLG